MEGVERNKVKLVPHNKEWENEFRRIKPILMTIFNVKSDNVQYVGSTAVRGIVAKPILDIAINLESFSVLNIDGMAELGYEDRLEAGVPGRRLFVLKGNEDRSLHHIHCFERNGDGFRKQVFFRDYLIGHPEIAMQYSELKIGLALITPDDRKRYTEGKDRFVQSILEKMDSEVFKIDQ